MDSLTSSFVTDLLEGQNLTISNLVVNCPPSAMGHFSGTSEVPISQGLIPVSYTHLRAHETVLDLVCRLLLEKKTTQIS